MTVKRVIRFGVLKGRVRIAADFDAPMSLAEFASTEESATSASSEADGAAGPEPDARAVQSPTRRHQGEIERED